MGHKFSLSSCGEYGIRIRNGDASKWSCCSIANGNGTERMQRDADSTFWLAPALVRMENKDDDDAGKGR